MNGKRRSIVVIHAAVTLLVRSVDIISLSAVMLTRNFLLAVWSPVRTQSQHFILDGHPDIYCSPCSCDLIRRGYGRFMPH